MDAKGPLWVLKSCEGSLRVPKGISHIWISSRGHDKNVGRCDKLRQKEFGQPWQDLLLSTLLQFAYLGISQKNQCCAPISPVKLLRTLQVYYFIIYNAEFEVLHNLPPSYIAELLLSTNQGGAFSNECSPNWKYKFWPDAAQTPEGYQVLTDFKNKHERPQTGRLWPIIL